MIFGIPTKKDWEILKKEKEKNIEFKKEMCNIVLGENDFLRKIGVISKEEYWKSRLEIDIEKNGLNPKICSIKSSS